MLNGRARTTSCLGTWFAPNICKVQVFGVEPATMMRSEIAKGIALESQVMCILQRQSSAIGASKVAELLGVDSDDVLDVLDRLYISSKLEMRPGLLRLYRVPGRSCEKPSLPN